MNRSKRIFTLAATLLFSGVAFGGVKVIGHSTLSAGSASESEIQDLFMGKESELGGQPVTVINQSGPAYGDFVKSVLNRSEGQMESYWARLTFTGKGERPDEVADDAAVINFIQANPSAIGFVDAGADTGDLKVLLEK